jgi:hypothetical protein
MQDRNLRMWRYIAQRATGGYRMEIQSEAASCIFLSIVQMPLSEVSDDCRFYAVDNAGTLKPPAWAKSYRSSCVGEIQRNSSVFRLFWLLLTFRYDKQT